MFHTLEFVVALAAMLTISWRLTLAAAVVVPVAMVAWAPLVGLLKRRDRRVLEIGGEVNSRVAETVGAMRLVKSAGAEARETLRFRRLLDEHLRSALRAESWRALAAPLTELLAAAGTLVLLWYGGRLVVGGTVTGPEFVGFLALSLKLYQPVKNLAKFPALAQPGLVAAERVFAFLGTEPEIAEADDAVAVDAFESAIELDGVSFSYRDATPAIRDVSITIPRGATIALVGRSGSGKSTVIDLLSRFVDPTEGRVSIDGVDARRMRIRDLRRMVGIVAQETILFHDTVRANIAYARPEATDAEVEGAARAAHAHDFVSALADGYETVIGERGVELSGGERQRIAIARALLQDPAILVLDEATSALDSESDRIVRDAIARLTEGRTVIVATHRLATVRDAGRIYVMEAGRVVEEGTHEELLRSAGVYRKLYDLQLGGEAIPR